MAAALTNDDFFEKVMVAIMNMEDIKYPNRGKPLLKWFCFKSESDMKKETLMDLGKYIFSMLHLNRRTKNVHFSPGVEEKIKTFLLECNEGLTVGFE